MIKNIFKNIFTRTIVLYVLVFVTCVYGFNKTWCGILRVDYLHDFGNSPMQTLKMEGIRYWIPAIRYYKLLSQAYQLNGRAEEMIGYCYFLSKDLQSSRDYYMKALALSPQRAWLNYNLGIISYLMGDQKKAKEYFTQVVNGDYSIQVNASFLSSLGKLEDEGDRKRLVDMTYQFVLILRQQSAMFLVSLLTSQEITDEKVLQPVLHPWSYLIIPGKEWALN